MSHTHQTGALLDGYDGPLIPGASLLTPSFASE